MNTLKFVNKKYSIGILWRYTCMMIQFESSLPKSPDSCGQPISVLVTASPTRTDLLIGDKGENGSFLLLSQTFNKVDVLNRTLPHINIFYILIHTEPP